MKIKPETNKQIEKKILNKKTSKETKIRLLARLCLRYYCLSPFVSTKVSFIDYFENLLDKTKINYKDVLTKVEELREVQKEIRSEKRKDMSNIITKGFVVVKNRMNSNNPNDKCMYLKLVAFLPNEETVEEFKRTHNSNKYDAICKLGNYYPGIDLDDHEE